MFTTTAKARRGSMLVESGLIATLFLLLLVAIMEGGRLGFTYNSISFAAHRAARYAAVRGSSSGHPTTASEVSAQARSLLVAVDPLNVGVSTTWFPDNHPGSSVEVTMSYSFQTLLVPLSSSAITLSTTSRQVITQ